jgi:hypothetical protein
VSDDFERVIPRVLRPDQIRSRDFDAPPADDPPDEPIPMEPPQDTETGGGGGDE